MLPKKRRVERDSFPSFSSNIKSLHGKNLSLRVFSKKGSDKTKFSFIVSKKVCARANKRNLLKRRGYSAVKDIIKNIKNGFVCVFFFKKTSVGAPYVEIEEDIIYLLKKAKVLR